MDEQETPNEAEVIISLFTALAQEQEGQRLLQDVFGIPGEKAVRQYIRGIVRDVLDEKEQEAQ